MMVKMSDGIGKIVEGYNSVISALENNRVLELVTLEKNIDSKKVQDLIEIAQSFFSLFKQLLTKFLRTSVVGSQKKESYNISTIFINVFIEQFDISI